MDVVALVCVMRITKSADLLRRLESAGWILDRVRGLHHVFKPPDRPGRVVVPHSSAGDTLDEALAAAEEAASAWIDSALDTGETIPSPSPLDGIRHRPDYAGWTFGVITLDPALLDDTIERVNITLPRRVLKRLDALARAAGESRSGYIAHLTLEEPRRIA